MLISDKIDFKTKAVISGKGDYFIMTRWSFNKRT